MRIAAANARPRWGQPDAGAERGDRVDRPRQRRERGCAGLREDAPRRLPLLGLGHRWCSLERARSEAGLRLLPRRGRRAGGPAASTQVIADVDLARVREERHNFDATGHYSRADVFELRVDRRRLSVADLGDEPVSLD